MRRASPPHKITAQSSLPLAYRPNSIYKGFLSGDVAQLGERRVRNAEARGSIPLISTIVNNLEGLPSVAYGLTFLKALCATYTGHKR